MKGGNQPAIEHEKDGGGGGGVGELDSLTHSSSQNNHCWPKELRTELLPAAAARSCRSLTWSHM